MARNVLILLDPASPAASADALAASLRAEGAQVAVRTCAAPYDAVLDAIEAAESVVFWA
jgi:hypothetical protein